MTTTTISTLPTAERSVAPLSLGRDIRVEARKMVDTRAGLILALLALPLMAAAALGRAFLEDATTLDGLVTIAAMPASYVLMVLAILLVSAEFARTASVTFTLDPHRGRVVAAKALTVLLTALAATLVALGIACLAGAIARGAGRDIAMTLHPGRLALVAGSVAFTGLTAVALALLLRNAPGPIVVLLLWPTVAMLLGKASTTVATVLTWINIDAVLALREPTPQVWGQLATSVLFWVVVPAAVGVIRLVRDDL